LSVWSGDLGLDSGIPQSVYRIDTTDMTQIGLKGLKPGESFAYEGGSITFEGYVQWVNLNFVADPGKHLALLGGIVAILGLLASLFTRRRRIWIRVGDQVEVAGLAKNAAPGLEVEMQGFVKMLKGEKEMSRSWAFASNYLVYSAMAVYAISFLAHLIETAWAVKVPADKNSTLDYKRTEKVARIATALMILGFLLLLAGVIARGISAGRVPWGNMYEFSITGALAFSGAYLLALRKYDLRWLGLLVSVSVLLTIGTAITVLYVPSAPLVPALKSEWLVIHVSTAIISGGVFLLSNVIASAYLYLDRMEKKGERTPWAKRLPDLETLDLLSYRLVAFVFPLWTFSVIAGAIWAESAWGRYWGWDPKETWAFITWVAYAAYLHARVTIGWRGRRAAWLCLFAGSTFLFNYVYVNIWGTGKHTYSGL
jgi:cytochrome c-type biogenesis protein CcsB